MPPLAPWRRFLLQGKADLSQENVKGGSLGIREMGRGRDQVGNAISFPLELHPYGEITLYDTAMGDTYSFVKTHRIYIKSGP